MTGGTDSKHYGALSAHGSLRYVPYMLSSAGDLHMIHGTNERVGVADFGHAICVYKRLMQLYDDDVEA